LLGRIVRREVAVEGVAVVVAVVREEKDLRQRNRRRHPMPTVVVVAVVVAVEGSTMEEVVVVEGVAVAEEVVVVAADRRRPITNPPPNLPSSKPKEEGTRVATMLLLQPLLLTLPTMKRDRNSSLAISHGKPGGKISRIIFVKLVRSIGPMSWRDGMDVRRALASFGMLRPRMLPRLLRS
jgi:hypothetical protein